MDSVVVIFIAFIMGAILQGIFPTREGWDAILLLISGGVVVILLTVFYEKWKTGH